MGKGVERQDRGGRKGALKRVSEVSKDSLTRDGRGMEFQCEGLPHAGPWTYMPGLGPWCVGHSAA